MVKDTNTGKNNSGDWNSGDWNSGHYNSGDRNSGNSNSGYYNSGNSNSGYWNSGYYNSGNFNSGDRNSGNSNSGDRNSGYGNSSDRQSGIFNSTDTTLRMFNKETNLKWDDIDHPHFRKFYLTKWIPEENMTYKEKKIHSDFHILKGYLKTFTYKEAWANFWKDTDEDNRQKFLNLPNFDPEVFEEITGIKVDTEKPCEPDEITVNGVKYRKAECAYENHD